MLQYDDLSVDSRIIVYDKGIDITSLDASLGEFDTYAQHQIKVRAGDAWLPRVEFREPLIEQIDDFVTCISSGGNPLASGRSGLEVVRQLEELSRRMQCGLIDER